MFDFGKWRTVLIVTAVAVTLPSCVCVRVRRPSLCTVVLAPREVTVARLQSEAEACLVLRL